VTSSRPARSSRYVGSRASASCRVAHLVEAVTELCLALQGDRDRHQRPDHFSKIAAYSFARIVIPRRM
jgi:hypothetical protein